MKNIKTTLYKGDCLIEMDKIADGSVDAIICDPPYGTTACKWDSIIPFEPMWERLNKLIKPNGAIALFGSEPFSSALRMSNIKNYKYDWVWDKVLPSDFLNAKVRPMRVHENIMIFNSVSKYNPQMIKRSKPIYGKAKKSRLHKDDLILDDTVREYTHKCPMNIITFKRLANLSKEKVGHPTQKPVALMEYLVRTYTNKGETVLDFTMGSGSTGVACMNTDRNFIGIEQDDKYFEIATRRINNAKSKLRLF